MTERPDDKQAILDAIATYEAGWNSGDATLAMQHYAEQIDWTNAFGDRFQAKADLMQFLTQLFQIKTVMAGALSYQQHEVRFISQDVALVRSRSRVHGQQLVDGSPHGVRNINHLRVFQQIEGKWLIVSQLVSQELDATKR